MSVLRNFLIFVGVVVLLIVGWRRHADHQESVQLRQAFDDRHIPLIIDHLMASTKYAEDLRQAGYNIPPDGAIIHLGGMEFLGIPGELLFYIRGTGESSIRLQFDILSSEEEIDAYYILDSSLNIDSTRYSQLNDQGIREDVTISSEDEQRLLAIIQSEIHDLIDRMEEQLYGEEES